MTLSERELDLRAVVGEHVAGDIQRWFTAVMCDGCGKIAKAADAEALAPLIEDWHIADGDGLDLCPSCSAELAAR